MTPQTDFEGRSRYEECSFRKTLTLCLRNLTLLGVNSTIVWICRADRDQVIRGGKGKGKRREIIQI